MDRLVIGAEVDLCEEAGDVALGDWNVLLSAVRERLRGIAAEHAPSPSGRQVQGPAAHFPAAVLDCAAALDQLHTTLMHEIGRRRRLELDFFDARMALQRVRHELASTRVDEQQARHLAAHDGLTLLPNRGSFLERLDRALSGREAQPPELAVLFLDLDGFKPINDAHGHDVGDALLRIVAARLSRAVRADDAVGRLGGDEFACLLANVAGREQLGHLAVKLYDAVAAPLRIGPIELSVRPSIGIAVCPGDGLTASILLKRADSAMYRAKRTQSGHAFFERSADTQSPPSA